MILVLIWSSLAGGIDKVMFTESRVMPKYVTVRER